MWDKHKFGAWHLVIVIHKKNKMSTSVVLKVGGIAPLRGF